MLPDMAVGPFSRWAPPSGDDPRLLAPVGKEWVLSPRPQPLGGWARLVRSVVARLPDLDGLAVSRLLPPGTVLRVASEDGRHARVLVNGYEQAMKRDWLEPAKPPPTAWERLLGPDDLG